MFEPTPPEPPPNRVVHETDWPTLATIIGCVVVGGVAIGAFLAVWGL